MDACQLLQGLNQDLANLIASIRPSIVCIGNQHGHLGAGAIWHSDGLILTNAHVIRRGPLQVETSTGQTFSARILAVNRQRDLAALSVAATALPTAPIGNSVNLQAGQWVMAMGNPGGVPGAVTAGVVIGELVEHPAGLVGNEWLAVNLHYRPGYSGGALIDRQGELIGINTFMTGPDVGVAVPVHVAKRFLKEALASTRVA